MLNLTLSDEQVISLVEQLPKKKKKELLEHLLFEQWIDSREGQKEMKKRERESKENKTFTLQEMRKKLKLHGKKV